MVAPHLLPLLQQGMTAFQAGNYQAALSIFDQVISAEPGSPDAHYHRAHTLLKLGQVHEAVNEFSIAISVCPSHVKALFNRGTIMLNRLGNAAAAIADFDQVIALDRSHRHAFVNRALAHREMKRPALAIEDTIQALRLKPDSSRTLYVRGLILLDTGDALHAKSDFERALSVEPNNEEYATALRQAMARL